MKIRAIVDPLIDAVIGRMPQNVAFSERDRRIVDRDWYIECAGELSMRITLDSTTLKTIG